MYRVLVLVIAAVIVVKVSASDAKHAPPTRAPARVAAVQPLPPPPPAPVLEVMVDDEAESEEAEAEEDQGIDLDVAFERARVATSGGIQGVIRDSRSGEAMAGVTIIATSPSLVGAQAAISDENGFFRLVELPAGTYLVTLYYLETTVEYSGIQIAAGETTPFFHSLDSGNDNVVHTITIDERYIVNIPVPGRTFESVLGAAADSQDDVGVTFSSQDLVENTYIVDGDAPEVPTDPDATIY